METCMYCDQEVIDETLVPAVDDDAAWTALALFHRADCEWIDTRAHRRKADETKSRILTITKPGA